MKLLNSIRWRPSRRITATTLSWTRRISISCRTLEEAAITSSKTQDLAVPERAIPKRTRKNWTADELQLVADELRKGASYRAIAALLPDRSMVAVEMAMQRLQPNNVGLSKTIKRKSWTAEEKVKLLRLKEAGVSFEDVASQFPYRTTPSLKQALHRPRSDTFWSTASQGGRLWTAEADKNLIEGVASGHSIEKLATSFDRSIDAVRSRVKTLGIQMPSYWTPQEDKTLLRMVNEGFCLRQIGSHLGRSLSSVKSRWQSVRPKDFVPPSGRSGRSRWNLRQFVPSSTEMKTVERLRQEGSTWQDITAFMFPNRQMTQLRRFFQRAYKLQREKPTRKDIYFEIPSADVPDVQKLRSTGSTWKQIADAKYPGIHWQRVRLRCLEQLKLCSEELGMNAAEANVQQTGNINLAQTPRVQAAHSTWHSVMDELYLGLSYQQVRHASSVRQTHDHGKPGRPVGSGLRLSSADLAEIQRLRESRHTWQHITDTMYPSQSIQQVQYAFKRQFDGHRERRPVFEISSADLAEIHHLRQSQKTWQQIADAKYPGTAYWLVRDAFTRQFDGQTTGRPKFTIPSADFAKIRSLREVKMSWTAIATLMYPNIKYQTLSNAFAQQTGEGGESKITRLALVMTSADLAKIRSLREAEASWTAIVALMYPHLSVTTVRAAFFRQTGDRDAADGWRPRLNITPTDMADVRRLRSEGRTWEQIKDMKYPGRYFQVIRKAFLRQDDGNIELKRQSPSRMSSVEVADIQRLRDEGMTWPQIRDIKYPGRNHEYVAKAFLQHGGVRSERKRRQPQTTVMSSAETADSQGFRKKGKTREPIHAPKNSVKSSQRLRHVSLQQSKPKSARNPRSPRVSISPAVLADIQRLRAADTPWREITALYLPDKSLKAARMLILRRMEGLHGTDNKHMWLRPTGAPRALNITPADFQEIRRLLKAKMLWKQITLLKFPSENHWNVRKAFVREEEKRGEKSTSALLPLKMNLSDIREIQSLRQAKTPWKEITRMKYPDEDPLSVRKAYLRDKKARDRTRAGRPRALELAPADIRKIERLLGGQTSWQDITLLLYPDQHLWNVRKAFLRWKEDEANEGRGRQSNLEFHLKDIVAIKRLRKAKRTWEDVTALMYPDRNTYSVRRAFHRHTADKTSNEEESDVNTEEEE